MRTLDRVGFALGHPARAAMVSELLSGRFLPSGELAKIAQSAPSTASEHLAVLADAGLVRSFWVGRHRYYTLASDNVARGLEALGTLAQPAVPRTLSANDRFARVRTARVCWDHVAGELGTRLRTAAIDAGLLTAHGDDAVVTANGTALLRDLGVEDVPVGSIAGGCVDLTERRLHLRGPFAKALFRGMCDRGWVVRARGRELRVTSLGARELNDRFGLTVPA